jgi:1-acyl-sn-glycerol-3-phosphate acyltransferase
MKQKQEKKSKSSRNGYMKIHRWAARLVRWLFRIHPSGIENIPEGGCIICTNHIGYPDAIMLAAAFPRQVHFLAKKEIFKTPLLGPFMSAMGAVGVERDTADVGAIKKVVSLSQEGQLVAVFPQAHRFKGKNPADTPIKYGIAMMAYRSGMPVLPVCIKMKKQRYAPFRRIDIIVGKPMTYRDICGAESGRQYYEKAAHVFFNQACALGGYIPPQLESGAQGDGNDGGKA